MCLAIPGKILEIGTDATNTALVDVVGARRKVDLGLLEDQEPQPGDWVLIHVGFAMSKTSEEEAREQLRTLEMHGESEAALEEVLAGMMLITAAIALPFTWSQSYFAGLNRSLGMVSGLVSLCFGLFVVYQMGFVNGLFGHPPTWVPR